MRAFILRPLVFSALVFPALVEAQLGLDHGFLSFNTTSFSVQLVKDSQTLYSLKPRTGNTNFDFIPADMMSKRQANRNYHLGDITYRARKVGTSAWTSVDSSSARQIVSAQTASGSTLASANLAPTLPSGGLLNITRRWVATDNQLQLLFDVTNAQSTAVEVGALGAPLEFNNVSHILKSCKSHTLRPII